MRPCSVTEEYTIVHESLGLETETLLVRNKTTQEIRKCRQIDTVYYTKSARADLEEAIYDMLRIRCPYMIHYTDVFTEAGRRIYSAVLSINYKRSAEEYLQEYRSKGEHIPESRLWSLMVRIVKALHYLHDPAKHNGRVIVHRDIRPASIYMDDEDQIYLGDSLVCKSYACPGDCVTGSTVTSTAYTPPEHIEGGRYTAAYDMWSLGCTIFELATGIKYSEAARARYPNAPYVQALAQMNAEQLVIPGYSTSFSANIQRMLSVEEDERPTASNLLTMSNPTSNASSLANSTSTTATLR